VSITPVRQAAGDLPVLDVLDAAVAAARGQGRVAATRGAGRVVLEAPAGAGKTTVLPLALAEDPAFDHGRIVVLEPRRVAARAAARRMSMLVGDRVGGHVGVTTRDDRRTSAATRVEVVTEGVLVRRLQRDPTLEGTSVVVLDEFHERSLEADLALAFALDVADLRDDLSLVVMSATLAGERVATLLGDATVVSSDGRLFPVEVEHREHSMADRLEPAVVEAVLDALHDHDGDVLAFLPGVREINRTIAELSGRVEHHVRLLPLHGGLPSREQDEALEPPPPGVRHVVVATDLAESSLTVPGVRVVVDSGLAREPRYDPATGLSRLVTVRISRDRAEQRAGRAGRVREGTAVRLWPQRTSAGLDPVRTPAVQQEDLAGFVLEAATWGVRDPAQLRTLDPPPQPSWDAAVGVLQALRALDQDSAVTDHGRRLVELPLPPRLGHLVVGADADERRLAVELAALLGDRDVLSTRRGSSVVDLADRVAVLRGRRPGGGASVRDGRVASVGRDVRRLARLVDAPEDRRTVSSVDVGRLLARAYPDRVARVRSDDRGRYVLTSGRGARLASEDLLAGTPLLVAADVDGAGADAWIRRAAALDESDLEDELGHLVQQVEHVAWDARRRDIVARRRTQLGELTLASGHLDRPDDQATTAALLEGVRDVGLDLLPWDDTTNSVRDRAGFLHEVLGGPWPPMDDAALLADLEQWLAPYLAGIHRVGHLARLPLLDALRQRIGWEHAGSLDRLAPQRLSIPSGRTAKLRYEGDGRVVLAAKLQEFFGLRSSPTVADGAVPVTVELLSPAGRPAAVTSDLAGFWEGAYHDVRADLRGRYPKHPWPEDPTTAPATARTKKRM
jgi:ATP-dependent helicase HrpB